MFGLLHVPGHQVEGSEGLPTPHALQNVTGLLLTLAKPNILTSHLKDYKIINFLYSYRELKFMREFVG